MEQVVTYESIMTCIKTQPNACDDCEHEVNNVGRGVPVFYTCPSAERMKKLLNDYAQESLAKGNYAANFGADNYISFQDPAKAGAFGVAMVTGWEKVTQSEAHASMMGTWKAGTGQGNTIADLRDGTSNTILASEVLGFDSERDARGVWTSTSMGSSVFTARTEPNSKTNDNIVMCEEAIPSTDALKCTENRSNGDTWAAARSRHSGGVVAARCDASVTFYNESIDLNVWRALCTRTAGEVVGTP
jgi:hypothetical protein